MPAVLRRPLLATCLGLTALAGAGIIGIGIAAVVVNSAWFGIGIAVWLISYGAVQLLLAWLVTRGSRFALGLVVASSLLHVCVVGSFMMAGDPAQFWGSLAVAPFVLTCLVTAVLAVTRDELAAAKAPRAAES
ncbi:MAG TPA: hypothetical protein PJ992_07100 [Arachnia sp.]|nr:hypothetical protein [Arachnia sp.]